MQWPVSMCAISSANMRQQTRTCWYPCLMPVLSHAAWAHLSTHVPYPALPCCYLGIPTHTCGMFSAAKWWPLGIPVCMPAVFQHCHIVTSACMFIPTVSQNWHMVLFTCLLYSRATTRSTGMLTCKPNGSAQTRVHMLVMSHCHQEVFVNVLCSSAATCSHQRWVPVPPCHVTGALVSLLAASYHHPTVTWAHLFACLLCPKSKCGSLTTPICTSSTCQGHRMAADACLSACVLIIPHGGLFSSVYTYIVFQCYHMVVWTHLLTCKLHPW